MVTEKRYIEVNALMEDRIWKCGGDPYDPYYMGYQDALDNVEVTIDNQSTANVVEVPCRIGDHVWAIRNYKGHKHPQDGFVHEMYFTDDMRLMIVIKHIARCEWGKEIFATREDAVAAIVGERKD